MCDKEGWLFPPSETEVWAAQRKTERDARRREFFAKKVLKEAKHGSKTSYVEKR